MADAGFAVQRSRAYPAIRPNFFDIEMDPFPVPLNEGDPHSFRVAADHIPECSRSKRIQALANFSCPLAPK